MSKVERLTVTLTPDMAEQMRAAVDAGDYASTSEVVRDAMRDWRHKRTLRQRELDHLAADIAVGADDAAGGRTAPYDAARIVGRAKRQRSSAA